MEFHYKFLDILFLLAAQKLCQGPLKIFYLSSQEPGIESNPQLLFSLPHAHIWCSVVIISVGSSFSCSTLQMAVCPPL